MISWPVVEISAYSIWSMTTTVSGLVSKSISEHVIRSLDRNIEWHGKPQVIRCDNGPEYIKSVTLLGAATRASGKPLL